MITLYSYFRSSAAYRVRIALNLKKIAHHIHPIHLLKDGGKQHSPEYQQLNPSELIPTLIDDAQQPTAVLTQSMAILEYLEELQPEPALLPHSIVNKAWVRSIALSIACDMHPLTNLRVLQHLKKTFNVEEEEKNNWYRYWCERGLTGLEKMLATDPRTGEYCFQDTPTLADCCLIPQIFNALRVQCDVSQFPVLMRIYQNCMALPEFIQAAPAQQIDAE